MSEVKGLRTNNGSGAEPARADEEALLDEALQQADQRLVASLREDELRRRRRRRWAIGGIAMTITMVGIIAGLMLAGTDTKPADASKGEATQFAEKKVHEIKRNQKGSGINAQTAPASRPATQPLPISDSFEKGTRVPDGWRKGARIEGVNYIWDKKAAHEGKASLCLKKTANRFFPIAEWSRKVSHKDNESKQIKVNAWVKAKEARKAIIDVQFFKDEKNWDTHQWAAYIGEKGQGDKPADHDWKEYTGVVDIPAGTKEIGIGLQIYGPGTVWFDDLTVDYVDVSKSSQ